MNLFRLFLLGVFSFLCLWSNAQSFDDAIDRKESPIRFSDAVHFQLRYTDVGGRYSIGEKGWTGNVTCRFDEWDNISGGYHYENTLVGDLIYRIAHYKRPSTGEQAFSSGIVGWHQMYFDVMKKDRLIISPGISYGDLMFGSEREDTIPQFLEPNGYYFIAGPALRTSVLLTNGLFVDGFIRYDVGMKLKGRDDYEDIKGYPKPHFLTLMGAIYHKSHLFASARVVQMFDRGDNNDSATRVDISFGIWATIR
ncbi:MAG: hypothetical protein RL220_1887 [Bacteroidota bacterium]|jgi:hypothetical protein